MMTGLCANKTINPMIVLATLGDYDYKGSEYATAGVENLNSILENLGLALGAILIAIAVIKLVLSFADENAKSKQDAGMMFGAGILFISISGVLNVLDIPSLSDANTRNPSVEIAIRILNVIGTTLTYAGTVVFAIAVIMLVLAIAQENSDSYVGASKMIASSVGMLFGDGLISAITGLLNSRTKNANVWVSTIVGLIADVATWGALGFICCGVFKIVTGIRSEDEKDRNTGIRFLMVGIALLSMRAILSMFGLIGGTSGGASDGSIVKPGSGSGSQSQ